MAATAKEKQEKPKWTIVIKPENNAKAKKLQGNLQDKLQSQADRIPNIKYKGGQSSAGR